MKRSLKVDRSNKWLNAAVLVWGMAEATFFFIVPDVLLTAIAVRSTRLAVRASLFAALGAVLGGLLVQHLASLDPERATRFLTGVPGISDALIVRAQGLMEAGPLRGLLTGPLLGIPYKIFAVEAGATGVSPLAFALMSVLARLPRFVILSLVAGVISRTLLARLAVRTKYVIHVVLWIGFYLFYFSTVG